MGRLSDLIKQGKVPEKNDKSIQDERDKIRIRELAELKTKKETVVEEKKHPQRQRKRIFPVNPAQRKKKKPQSDWKT